MRVLPLLRWDALQAFVASSKTKGLGEQMGEVREVGVAVRFCCKSLVVRLDSHSKGEVVRHSCIRRQSIGRFRDETAEE
jgi:hypothetical protein